MNNDCVLRSWSSELEEAVLRAQESITESVHRSTARNTVWPTAIVHLLEEALNRGRHPLGLCHSERYSLEVSCESEHPTNLQKRSTRVSRGKILEIKGKNSKSSCPNPQFTKIETADPNQRRGTFHAENSSSSGMAQILREPSRGPYGARVQLQAQFDITRGTSRAWCSRARQLLNDS